MLSHSGGFTKTSVWFCQGSLKFQDKCLNKHFIRQNPLYSEGSPKALVNKDTRTRTQCRPRHQTFSSWGSFKAAPTTVILQYRTGSESQWFLILLTCSFSTFFYRMVLKHRVHATTLICISQWGNKHKSLSPACKATDTWAHHAIFPGSQCTSIFPFGK